MNHEFHKFWMVKGGGPCGHHHESKAIALAEAKRLARKHPDTAFFVLEAVEVVVKRDLDVMTLRDPPWARRDDDDRPF